MNTKPKDKKNLSHYNTVLQVSEKYGIPLEEAIEGIMSDLFIQRQQLKNKIHSLEIEQITYKYFHENPQLTRGMDITKAIEHAKEQINKDNKEKSDK